MTARDLEQDLWVEDSDRSRSRRAFLATSGVAAAGALAGCGGLLGGSDDSGPAKMNEFELSSFQGSGPFVDARPAPGGTSIRDLPDMAGDLRVYLGGGEGGLYVSLFRTLQEIYPNLNIEYDEKPSSQLAGQIADENEADQIRGDVFLSVDAGSLGAVTDDGATQALPASAIESVPSAFQDPNRNWVGVAGRARAIPYNTDRLSAGDIPSKVADFPGTDAFQGMIGWAPSYSAFQSFVTAMLLLRGRDATKQWLEDIKAMNVSRYPDEQRISREVADGELNVGFANHYYALRVKAWNDDPPIDLAFTAGDAGSLVNVSGIALLNGTDEKDLATNFVRHLLSAEAQEFFATQTYAYPMIPEVAPVGDLPTIEELNTPDIDLTKLSDTKPTTNLLSETGLL